MNENNFPVWPAINQFPETTGNPSFEQTSAFNNSPFGKNWDKQIVLSDQNADQDNGGPYAACWIYHLEKSSNGVKLINDYQNNNIVPYINSGNANDKLTDIAIYYETDDAYNTFGSVCFIKMNQGIRNYLAKGYVREWFVNEVCEKEKGTLSKERLREALDDELDSSSGSNILGRIGAKLLLKLSEMIRDMQYEENVWNANSKNYDPVLPIAWTDKEIKKWNGFKKSCDHFFAKAKNVSDWLSENIPAVGEFLAGCVDTIVDIISAVIEAIDDILQVIAEIIYILKLVNAFIVGAVNELIDMAAGLVELVALMLTLTEKAERQKIKEVLENVIESYLREPSKILDLISQGFENLKKRYSSDKSEYFIAYQLGEDAVTVVAWAELIGAVWKGLKNIPKAFKKFGKWVEKTGKRLAAIEYSKIGEELAALRFKLLERSVINGKWKLLVNYAELGKARILEFQKMRDQYGLLGKNIATLKIRALGEDGKVIIKEYIGHASRGQKIPGSVPAPQAKPLKSFTDYLSNGQKRIRWYDSENKMLMQMDKDLEDYKIISMLMEWESTYTPCTVCRREILIRQTKYKAKVFVKSPKFKNIKGKLINVKTSKDFKKLIKQMK